MAILNFRLFSKLELAPVEMASINSSFELPKAPVWLLGITKNHPKGISSKSSFLVNLLDIITDIARIIE